MASSKVVQITNIAPQATRDQMQTLFGYLGKIEDIRLYPTIRDVACPVQSRICYVKFLDAACVSVAQHMTNTVFIDRALIVIPFQTTEIPDEQRALELTNNGTLVPGLFPAEPKLPPNVTNQLEGVHPNQVITTHDPRLVANGLPLYPALSATLDAAKVEEIRRTLLVTSIDDSVTALQLIDLFSEVAEVKYSKFCNRDGDSERYALVELTDQNTIIAALQLNGKELAGKCVKVYHATQAIVKPQAKSNEAAQREIEEAMSRVKEAQNMISAAIDPVIGLLAKEKKRSRSRGRRSRSPSHGRRSRRSRSRRHGGRSRSRSGSRRKRSRSRSRERKRKSRSPGHSSRSIRSRSSSRRRSRSRSRRSPSKSKSKPSSSSKSHDKYKDKRDDKKDRKDDKRDSKKDDAKDTRGDDKKEDESKREGSSAEYGGQNGSNKDRDSEKYKDKDKKYKDKSEKGKESKESKDKTSKSKSSRDKSGSRSPSKSRHRSPVVRKSRSPSRKKSPHSRRKSKSPPHSSRNKHSPHKRSRSPSKSSREDKKKDKDRSHDKEPEKERKKKDKKEDKESEKVMPSKVPRNYDEEEEGFDAAERGQARRDSSPSDGDYIEHNVSDNCAEEKEQDMEISTSP